MTAVLHVEQTDWIWTFALIRPEKMNALSSELVEMVIEAVAFPHARGARLLVFKGEGKNFSAGFDFGNLEESSDGDLLLRFVRVESLLHGRNIPMRNPCTCAWSQLRGRRGPVRCVPTALLHKRG